MSTTSQTPAPLGLWSGVGLCVASMVGAGIFLSSGYMAQSMDANAILLSWLAGAVLALLGVATYAELARQMPRSGGEYRYLSSFLHPAAGRLAGWVTMIVGFALPTAINAGAAVAFASTLVDVPMPKLWAAGAILLIACGHAARKTSKPLQNALVVAKVGLLAGFVVLGLGTGSTSWPAWTPPHPDTGFASIAGSLFYIGYAFSGWNTCAYNAEAFRDPARDVGRAMAIACIGVALLYLAINWIFVANLTPAEAAIVTTGDSQTATLGHLVTLRLIGDTGAKLMSLLAMLSFLSAMSAMLMVGPHIFATMARDGVVPKRFADHERSWGLALQVAVALAVVFLQSLQKALEAVGATLMLFAALSAIGLLVAAKRGRLASPPRRWNLIAAAVFAASSLVLLIVGLRQ